MANEQTLLKTPIRELPVSENFYLRSKLMGFYNIGDIVIVPVESLVKKEEFTYDWLGELTKLMTSQKMLHLLQPRPGSIVC
jgi:hypothetical protein